jgi:Tol biopolymer transport system component
VPGAPAPGGRRRLTEEDLIQDSTLRSVKTSRRGLLIWRAATIALLVVVALLAWPLVQRYREGPPPPPPVVRVPFTAAPGAELGAGDDPLDAAVSPAGDVIAFVATSNGRSQLWHRRVDGEQASAIAGTEGARHPAWSPDASALLFVAGGRLKTLTLATGAVRELAEAREPGGAAWLDDGSVVMAPPGAATLTTLRDGRRTAATALQTGDRNHVWPVRAPGGFAYVAVRDDGRRVMRYVRPGSSHDLGTTDGHAIVTGSVVLHVRGGALLAQRLDPGAGTLTGRATALVTSAGVVDGRALAAASERLLLVSPPAMRARELVWLERDGTRGPAASDHGDYWQVRVSPDDRAAAVTLLEPQLRTLDVYTVPLVAGRVTTGVTLALAADTDPVWSPDGGSLLFRSLQGGAPGLYARLAGRQGVPIEPVAGAGTGAVPTDWRASSGVLFHAATSRGDTDLFTLDRGAGTNRAVVTSRFNESDGRWSPDARLLAYVSDEFGQPDVFVQPWPEGGRVRVSTAGGTHPRWGRDGRTLVFLRGADIVRVELTLDPLSASAPAAVAAVPGIRDFDAAHHADRLLAILPSQTAAPPAIQALVDWQSAVP